MRLSPNDSWWATGGIGHPRRLLLMRRVGAWPPSGWLSSGSRRLSSGSRGHLGYRLHLCRNRLLICRGTGGAIFLRAPFSCSPPLRTLVVSCVRFVWLQHMPQHASVGPCWSLRINFPRHGAAHALRSGPGGSMYMRVEQGSSKDKKGTVCLMASRVSGGSLGSRSRTPLCVMSDATRQQEGACLSLRKRGAPLRPPWIPLDPL